MADQFIQHGPVRGRFGAAFPAAFVQGEPRPRTRLVLWFFAQWVVLPIDLLWRPALVLVLVVLDYQGNSGPQPRFGTGWARRLGPARLGREWRRDPAVWEAHLRTRLAVVAAAQQRAAADPAATVRWEGRLRRIDSLPYWYLGRDDFGTLPLDRILAVCAAEGMPGWGPAGPTVQLRNAFHRQP
ncbi:hypothetical protein AB0D08_29210 [Kitasatospora sp. NPDC048540]|uniref:hypothetical protein n=1 Tax=unclassified Kitasatospora TaxID=2633591 RepID=UPI00053AAED3|nr:hypothetical protein [Kitasatospora sp. MBT63]